MAPPPANDNDMETTAAPLPEVVAAADLGSNSFHLAIARVVDGELMMVDRIKERVSLRSGLDDDDLLDDASQERALTCLALFGQRLRELPSAVVRAVGTDTLRVAKNAKSFIKRANATLGHPIEVISGEEEARLIYRGVVQELPYQDGKRQLVIDVGGGSTECVLGVGLSPEHAVSLRIGHVGFSTRFFGDGALTDERFHRAIVAARLEIERLRGPFFRHNWDRAIGSSGTMESVQAILRASGWTQDAITRDGVARLQARLVEQGRVEALSMPELSTTRAQTIAGGVAIIRAIFDTLPIDAMHTSSSALREGVLYDMLGRYAEHDVRETTIATMMERFVVDRDQATRVERTALRLLAQCDWFTPAERRRGRRLLAWASRIHEIGLAISFHGYHKHGAYIVQNATMPGFSTDETTALAALVLTHRKKLDRSIFDSLPDELADLVKRLAVVERLAVHLHRNRSWRPLPDIQLEARGDDVAVVFPEGFLEARPLTVADFQDEIARLSAVGYTMRIR